jgi:hypothetical protein
MHSQPFGRKAGWYWWKDIKAPAYHGPFDNKWLCERDLEETAAADNASSRHVGPRSE